LFLKVNRQAVRNLLLPSVRRAQYFVFQAFFVHVFESFGGYQQSGTPQKRGGAFFKFFEAAAGLRTRNEFYLDEVGHQLECCPKTQVLPTLPAAALLILFTTRDKTKLLRKKLYNPVCKMNVQGDASPSPSSHRMSRTPRWTIATQPP
jgi:hypothetical protein